MKIKLFLVSIFICGFLLVTLGQRLEFVEVTDTIMLKQKLEATSEATFSISSKFRQEKHLWMLKETIFSTGEFIFKKPNSIKWQYNSPILYTISIHNNTFTIDNNGNITTYDVQSNPLFKEINKIIATAIRGDFINNPDFESRFLVNDEQFLAILIPMNKNVKSMLNLIEIYLSKATLQVDKVIFREAQDDYTLIYFEDKFINRNIPTSDFILGNP